MDAYHSDTHGPGTIADAQFDILVVSLHVLFAQAILHDKVKRVEYLDIDFVLPQLLEKRLDLSLALLKSAQLHLTFSCLQVVVWPATLEYTLLPNIDHSAAPNVD